MSVTEETLRWDLRFLCHDALEAVAVDQINSARKHVTGLLEGEESFRTSTPAQPDDSDILFDSLCLLLEEYIKRMHVVSLAVKLVSGIGVPEVYKLGIVPLDRPTDVP